MDNPKYIYFLGIGGIGMSALARYFNNASFTVSGYDKTPSPLTYTLIDEGLKISFIDDVDSIPRSILENKAESFVVYTPAIPRDNKIFNFFKEQGFVLKKRAEVLGMVTAQTVNLSVAGTHGKTTTSCIVATILQHSNMHFSAFLGGISTNLASNYYHQSAPSEHLSVTEADEFDRSFLQLKPQYAVITSTDADHLDIYGKQEELEKSYQEFASLVLDKKNVFVAYASRHLINGVTYSASNTNADYYAVVKSRSGKGTHFSIYNNVGEAPIEDLYLNIPGLHNLENAIGAALMTRQAGVALESILAGLANFKGIKRRFEYILTTEKVIYIDDYAHHPSELRAIISSVRELYPNKKITAIFQPHLFSRTQDFMAEFAYELSQVDELLLVPIYPARELPIAGVTSEAVLAMVDLSNAQCVAKEEVIDTLKNRQVEVLLTLGAGDIDRLVLPLQEYYAD
ncbi:MAG TPA: UDP-N-acetylmuramate--L-alanine ligase [Bacteroidetes bacterium]|nr:UDP-N-acetylmuramate--L-alanine ligase [Bacteroidota bacterium]